MFVRKLKGNFQVIGSEELLNTVENSFENLLGDMEKSKNPLEKKELTDESPMPNGMYKGRQMANVPAQHLIWIYENRKCREDVANYVKNNLKALKDEIKREETLKENYIKNNY